MRPEISEAHAAAMKEYEKPQMVVFGKMPTAVTGERKIYA
jgi:hypothetical protein